MNNRQTLKSLKELIRGRKSASIENIESTPSCTTQIAQNCEQTKPNYNKYILDKKTYEIRQNRLKMADQEHLRGIGKHDITSLSPSNFSQTKIKQLQDLFSKQSQNLKLHRDFLTAEVRKCHSKVQKYKLKMKQYKITIKQLTQTNQILKTQNQRLNDYIFKIISKMEIKLNNKTHPQHKTKDKVPIQPYLSSSIQSQISNQPNQQNLSNYLNNNVIDSDKVLNELNDKFQQLMYEYIKTKDNNIRKQTIELAKQIRNLKLKFNQPTEVDNQQIKSQFPKRLPTITKNTEYNTNLLNSGEFFLQEISPIQNITKFHFASTPSTHEFHLPISSSPSFHGLKYFNMPTKSTI